MVESVFKTNMVYIYLFFFKGKIMSKNEIEIFLNKIYKIKNEIEQLIIELEELKNVQQ